MKRQTQNGKPNTKDRVTTDMDKDGDIHMNRNAYVACEQLSSERYRAFVENIEEGVYELDIHGNFLYFNNSLAKIFGYPREDIQFRYFGEFMDEVHAKKGFDTFNRIYRTGQGISDLLWRIKDKDGNLKIIELSANIITNKEGEKIGFRGIARDITDKYQAQEALKKSEKRYRTLLDFVPYPIVVFSLKGTVSYLNPAFTEIFGWSLSELIGKKIPYVPPNLQKEADESIKKMLSEGVIPRLETKRLTKDGRTLDVLMRGAVYSGDEMESDGELVILRDITQEKRIQRYNDAMLRISMALPKYPELEGLLDYISDEIKELLNTEGALVILLDEERKELFFQGAAYDDSATQKRIKNIHFPADKGIASKVIRTGKPAIVHDTSKDPSFYPVVDKQLFFHTRNLLDVPLRSSDRIIGVLCALNKKEGAFDHSDVELLNMIAGTVALSIENARFSEEIKKAYKEVTSLSRAKDKVINHLSHELKTPLSVLSASLNILTKRLSQLPKDTWKPTIDRAQRNLERILELQYQVEDIMQAKHYEAHRLLSDLLDVCIDEFEALIADEVGEGPLVEKIKKHIDSIFGQKESATASVDLGKFVEEVIKRIKPLFSHRQLTVNTQYEPTPQIRVPIDPLEKVIIGLVKNAVENTPDEGKIDISVVRRGDGAEFSVRDFGVGITSENQRRIFEGFFATQDTMDYSTKRPYDFNAGGKGADLLRIKIFSERYNFKIHMTSVRCRNIPLNKDNCPGRISQCDACTKKGDCHQSAGTTFTVFFPAA